MATFGVVGRAARGENILSLINVGSGGDGAVGEAEKVPAMN